MSTNSKNPFLNNRIFTSSKEEVHEATIIGHEQTMTIAGTMNKSLILFLLATEQLVGYPILINGKNGIVRLKNILTKRITPF